MTSPSGPWVRSVGTALPANWVDQETLISVFREHWAKEHFNVERIEELHRSVQVGGRYLALPLEEYLPLKRFSERNDAFNRVSLEMGELAVRRALDDAGLQPRDVDHLFFVTVTRIGTPSLDARLVNRLGLRPDVKRTPIFGLGCVAGAAGTPRATDSLRAYPDQVAVMLSVELCSLTLQREGVSIPHIIASGLFGDGAAALVLSGAARVPAHRRPRIVAPRGVFYPDPGGIMGGDVGEGGFKVVLGAKVPALVSEHVREAVDGFLGAHGLRRSDIRHWIAHTGGPKVLQAFESALELPPEALQRSWDSLRKTGNLSSASVLFVLEDLLGSG